MTGSRWGRSPLKRVADVFVASFALVLASPILLVVALRIRRTLGSPVFFRQLRPGRGGANFTLLKFRTMLDAVGPDGETLPDAARVTPFGQWLRATSLDELPELVNVLRGDMSIVGPRPLLVEYLPLYSPEQARRHEVRPGITGWAQVNGRNLVSWPDRFRMDVWYVDNASPLLDARIAWMTVRKVIRREGITERGEVTMTKFSGNVG